MPDLVRGGGRDQRPRRALITTSSGEFDSSIKLQTKGTPILEAAFCQKSGKLNAVCNRSRRTALRFVRVEASELSFVTKAGSRNLEVQIAKSREAKWRFACSQLLDSRSAARYPQ